MDFTGKVAVVTGAASGFGAATVRRYAELGAKVVAADINGEGLDNVVHAIEAAGGTCVGIETDVMLGASVKAMIDKAVNTYSRLDILVNNAGAGHMASFLHELDEDTYDRMFNLNTKSVYWGVVHAVPVMIEQGGGCIVNTASIGAKNPRPKATAYNAAKGAVVVMTRGLARELARFKIRVNCVCPLASETNFMQSALGIDKMSDDMRARFESEVPLRRLTDPIDVANAILYLSSDEGQFLTGVHLDVDGGKSI